MNPKIYDNRNNVTTFFFIMLICTICARYCDSEKANAQDKTALHLVQCIRSECDSCSKYANEPAAIAHVLRKRAKQYRELTGDPMTLNDQIMAYCAVFDDWSYKYGSIRSSNIRNSTFKNPLHGKKQWWSRMKRWSERFIRNPTSIRDPTPEAMHFGGAMDIDRALKAGWILIVKYCNFYWGYGPKK